MAENHDWEQTLHDYVRDTEYLLAYNLFRQLRKNLVLENLVAMFQPPNRHFCSYLHPIQQLSFWQQIQKLLWLRAAILLQHNYLLPADILSFQNSSLFRPFLLFVFQLQTLGRPILSGLCRNTLDVFSNPLKDDVVYAERVATPSYKGYKVTGYSLANAEVLSVNYYDNYDFFKNIYAFPKISDTLKLQYDAPSSGGLSSRYNNVKGLLTGTWTVQINGTDTTTLYSAFYYDDHSRVI